MKHEALNLLQSGLSPSEVATRLNINPATVRVWKSRANTDVVKQPAETGTSLPPKPRKLNPEYRYGGMSFAKDKTPKRTNRNYRTVALDFLLISVIVGHASLVWYDCATQWSTPGAIGGGVTFLIVLAALLLASDETKNRTSEAALYFVLLVDCAAYFVHYPTFQRVAGIGNIETGAFAAFLCACSWVALYLFRDSKLT
jgi:hypothetical protein